MIERREDGGLVRMMKYLSAAFLRRAACRIGALGLAFLALGASQGHAADCAGRDQITGLPQYRGSVDKRILLCRDGYMLSYNPNSHVPDWVMEILSPESLIGPGDREKSSFERDPDLGAQGGEAVEPKDYAGSGYDRGHMAPAADMAKSQEATDQSFYMSNMAPQVGHGFNGGIWGRLEDDVRNWAKTRNVIVFTGPIYPKLKEIGTTRKIDVPSAFYKIAFDPAKNRAIGFILPNHKIEGKKPQDFIASIREIEDRTGLDFLAKLPKRTQALLETSKGVMWRASPEPAAQ